MTVSSVRIVTGASGFIGGRTAYYLATKGFPVVAILREGSQLLFPHPSITVVRYSESYDSFVQPGMSIDEIYHCAALTTANCDDDEHIYATNVRLAEYISSLCQYVKPRLLVFTSTVSVYGQVSADILTYETKPVNVNSYGVSKLLAEDIILSSACSITKCCLLRLPGTVGRGSHGNIVSRILIALSGQANHNSTGTSPLVLKNPSSLFNNVVCITDLLRYFSLLSFRSSCGDLSCVKTIPVSSEPIPLSIFVEELSRILGKLRSHQISWTSASSHTFTIDHRHSYRQGYHAPSTMASVSAIVKDWMDSTLCPP
jgi:nucleoside-diphosphate-sugar epimerase